MALKCRCICGCKLLVSSDSAGKRIKCPKCERKLRVPSDLVEKRREQLEARQSGPPPTLQRSKIENRLSSFVELPEPEPPPIQTSVNPPQAAPSQPSKSTKTLTSRRPPPLPQQPAARAPLRIAADERPELSDDSLLGDNAVPSALPLGSWPAADSDPTPKLDVVGEAAPLEVEDVKLAVRGYRADRDKVAAVRWLAAAILLVGLVGTVPAIIDVVEHALTDRSSGLSRWACGLFWVGLLQCAFAVYLVQLPDWSSVWVVTLFTLAIAAAYAAMFGLTLLSSDEGHFVQVLGLADRLRGGKATAWCLIMLSLMSLTSYFSGRVGSRWRRAFFA